ncbi:MAG: SRPBCC family protein [Chloroflexota bacterium]
MDYTVSVNIEATPERIWSNLVDVERWPEWTASVTKVQRLDDGRFGTGSRASVRQPKLRPMVWTVTEYEPARSFSWMAVLPGVTTLAEHRLLPGPGTTVTVSNSIRQTGLLAPIIGALYGRLTCRYLNMEAQGLKRRSELPPTASC